MGKLRIFLLLFTVVFVFQSCLEGNENRKEFYWNQTGCADPWLAINPEGGSENQISKDLVNYLQTEGIKNARVLKFKSEDPIAVCLACTCTTGVRIYVEVPTKYSSKMIDLGFVEA
ncbi:hypothetical protein JYB62_03905 [Algoriphagus lutimaris]|uniref:hypothetical protein n=1 Tax=Algoriphagus lutimaris TaxID=613197 RepID=UPI00196B9E61|nr:hypothetical protein [Algoriphagus lutimaris]MBN3519137.1 hypothetical protein [Algoriphagus lutimaris]